MIFRWILHLFIPICVKLQQILNRRNCWFDVLIPGILWIGIQCRAIKRHSPPFFWKGHEALKYLLKNSAAFTRLHPTDDREALSTSPLKTVPIGFNPLTLYLCRL